MLLLMTFNVFVIFAIVVGQVSGVYLFINYEKMKNDKNLIFNEKSEYMDCDCWFNLNNIYKLFFFSRMNFYKVLELDPLCSTKEIKI